MVGSWTCSFQPRQLPAAPAPQAPQDTDQAACLSYRSLDVKFYWIIILLDDHQKKFRRASSRSWNFTAKKKPAKKSLSTEVSQQRSLAAKKGRTKASFSQVEAAVFEGSLALKLHFHIFDCQFLREVLHGMRV
jgi:hypothetical protein